MMKQAIKTSIAGVALAIATFSTATTMPTAAQAEIGEVRHSPWLAIKFEQDGTHAPMRFVEMLRTEVTLKRRPFTIAFPVRGETDAYQIAAWYDENSDDKMSRGEYEFLVLRF